MIASAHKPIPWSLVLGGMVFLRVFTSSIVHENCLQDTVLTNSKSLVTKLSTFFELIETFFYSSCARIRMIFDEATRPVRLSWNAE
jgi:hypothetical protein